MKYRQLGKSGLKVSEISLGSWLTYGGYVEDQNAIKCIHQAYDLGINFFDTANVYRQGEAEEVVGKGLKNLPRESYVVATKVWGPMGDGPNERGLSRKHIMEQCHASLKRLGVDYIDLYQCHRYDDDTPLEETLRALDDLVRQGKILYAGTSNWSAVNIADAVHVANQLNLDRIVSNQPLYNMVRREIEADVIPVSWRSGIGQVVYSPLGQGVLTGKYKPGQAPPENSRATSEEGSKFIHRFLNDDTLAKVAKLQPIADELNCSMAQLALAWVLRRPEISSAIIGASRPEQVVENCKAIDLELSAGIQQRIEEILDNNPVK